MKQLKANKGALRAMKQLADQAAAEQSGQDKETGKQCFVNKFRVS